MARIAPKDLSEAIAAAKPGEHLELDSGEHVGQLVIDKPLLIEGRGASTWIGNRTGPVLIVRCPGVELRDLQIEVTGDLQHPAILAEGNCEPLLRNVAIRRGQLHVEGPLLSFATPPPIRLRELPASASPAVSLPARTATSLSLSPPPPSPPPPPTTGATRQPPVASARARIEPPPTTGATAPPSQASPSPSLSPRSSRRFAVVAVVAVVALGLVLVAVSGSTTPRSAATRASDPAVSTATTGKSGPERSASPAPLLKREPPLPDELQLTSNLRTSIEVVGWSQDEESFLLEITYGRNSSNPARWRVRALVDAPSEHVIRWQDLSEPPARVVAGEDEHPPWSKAPETIQLEDFRSGSALEPAQLDVRWCGNGRSPRFPTRARPLGRELELTWDSRGEQLAPTPCRDGDFGQVLLQVKDSPWRLMRFSPWKGSTSTVRVHRSPSGRRAVVVALFSLAGKSITRFYTRLLGPQIHIVSSDPERRSEALRLLGTPGLFMSENARVPIPPPSRILVRADDEEALRVARALQEKLEATFGLAELEKVGPDRTPAQVDDSYLWGDILIVLK
jgi:hypothetical protein